MRSRYASGKPGRSFEESHPGSPFYENDGLKIYYEEHGEGEPLVLVHGYGQDRTFWANVVDDYARYFRTITIDARSGGQSGVPEPGYTILDLAEVPHPK